MSPDVSLPERQVVLGGANIVPLAASRLSLCQGGARSGENSEREGRHKPLGLQPGSGFRLETPLARRVLKLRTWDEAWPVRRGQEHVTQVLLRETSQRIWPYGCIK